ncbi:MAG TPA: type II secretion system major pseudopilin GspG [Thermodesulfobacteriota bacterium]|nr:type II secretion system major pseudopilin GspG [Thermodesulfobacteriota bacterium]
MRVAARAAAGFTLIEILVVVTIIAILAALVAPKVIGRTDDAKRARVLTELRTIEAALAMYKLDNGTYPSTEQGLEALVQKPTVGEIPPNWREGGYLSKVPVDPWGQKYVYAYPGTRGEYDLYSLGADRQPGGEGIRADIFPDSQ